MKYRPYVGRSRSEYVQMARLKRQLKDTDSLEVDGYVDTTADAMND